MGSRVLKDWRCNQSVTKSLSFMTITMNFLYFLFLFFFSFSFSFFVNLFSTWSRSGFRDIPQCLTVQTGSSSCLYFLSISSKSPT
ncbi:hypothetical protein BDW59DRAFT_1121 [Aspergillus cavernicola]|uniref:Uncharacterized protein n=1 Tax=Aspergillus cavernicola TaxID=176166 RepID=A0ABR4J4F7_9EURO